MGKKLFNRIDAYVCPDLHIIITQIAEGHNGKPPALISCPQCKQRAQSQGYNVNQNFKPMVEFYTPSTDEIKALTISMDKAEFNRFTELVNKGMMASRLIKN